MSGSPIGSLSAMDYAMDYAMGSTINEHNRYLGAKCQELIWPNYEALVYAAAAFDYGMR